MKHNVGSYDATIRTLVGLFAIVIGHHLRSWWALAGLVPLLTGAFAFCPLYRLLGFDTCYQDDIDDRHLPPSKT